MVDDATGADGQGRWKLNKWLEAHSQQSSGFSSELSPQSSSPSHFQACGLHSVLLHWNSSRGQVRTAKMGREPECISDWPFAECRDLGNECGIQSGSNTRCLQSSAMKSFTNTALPASPLKGPCLQTLIWKEMRAILCPVGCRSSDLPSVYIYVAVVSHRSQSIMRPKLNHGSQGRGEQDYPLYCSPLHRCHPCSQRQHHNATAVGCSGHSCNGTGQDHSAACILSAGKKGRQQRKH